MSVLAVPASVGTARRGSTVPTRTYREPTPEQIAEQEKAGEEVLDEAVRVAADVT